MVSGQKPEIRIQKSEFSCDSRAWMMRRNRSSPSRIWTCFNAPMRCRSPSTGLRSLFRELNSSDWRSKSDARASRSARTSLRGSGSSDTQARTKGCKCASAIAKTSDTSTITPSWRGTAVTRKSPRCFGVYIETGNSKELFWLLASGFWLLLLANGERVTAYLLYNGSAS